MRATLAATEQLSDSLFTFHFQPERQFRYLAGQFTELTIDHPSDDRGCTRQLTLSSSPTEPLPAVTVNFKGARSSFKTALRSLRIGEEIHMDDAMGDFVLPLLSSIPLVWIAGGVGITPFRSMAKQLSDEDDHRDIRLFHSTNDSDDATFQDVFSHAGVTSYSLHTTGNDRLSVEQVIGAAPTPSETYFYIAGPEQMVKDLSDSLEKSGIAKERIITDAFLGYN